MIAKEVGGSMDIQETRIRNLSSAIKATQMTVADFAKSHDIDASYFLPCKFPVNDRLVCDSDNFSIS